MSYKLISNFRIFILVNIILNFFLIINGCGHSKKQSKNYWFINHKIKDYEYLVKKTPGDVDLMLSLGKLYLTKNNYEGAFKIFKEVLVERPNSNEALMFLGIIYLNMLSKSTESNKNYYNGKNSLIEKNITQYLERIHKGFRTIGLVTIGRKITPEFMVFMLENKYLKVPLSLYAEKFLENGIIEQELGENNATSEKYFNNAKKIAEKLTHIDPKNAKNHLLLGTIYGNLKNYEKAIFELKLAIKLFKQSKKNLKNKKKLSKLDDDKLSEAYFYLGISFKRLQLLEELHVNEYLRFGITILATPVNLLRKLLYQKGTVFIVENGFPKAIESFLKAIEIKPGWLEARYNLAETYQLSNQFEESIKVYAAIKKINREDHNIDISLSCLYKYVGRKAEAIKYLKSGWILLKKNMNKNNKFFNKNIYNIHNFNFSGLPWSSILPFSPYIIGCKY